jgi:hypothetical protein
MLHMLWCKILTIYNIILSTWNLHFGFATYFNKCTYFPLITHDMMSSTWIEVLVRFINVAFHGNWNIPNTYVVDSY